MKATASPAATLSLEEREQRFLALFGAWKSDETGDEINQMLQASRQSNRPDVALQVLAIRSIPIAVSTGRKTYISGMRIALEIEFPDEQAASVMRQLQNLPEMSFRFLKTDAQAYSNDQFASKEPLSVQEQHALLDQVFGSWQQEEGEEDLLSQIYGARRDAPREVNL